MTEKTRASMNDLAGICAAEGVSFENALNEWRRCLLSAAIDEAQGNQCAAADALGMHRNTLGRWMKDLSIAKSEHYSQRGRSREREINATEQTV